jgi:hypothetical protein
MLFASPTPRHTVKKSDDRVQVTLPSKRGIVLVLWFFLWLFMGGYMVYGFIFIAVASNKAIEIGRNSMPPVQPRGVFFFASICLSIVFVALLALGAFAIHRFIWVIGGKEIIEATHQRLTITKQVFRWKKSKEYSSEGIGRLRTNTQPLSMFLPGKKVKRVLGGANMILFDYGGRTCKFGLQISEAEAEQIIQILQEVLTQQNAGYRLTAVSRSEQQEDQKEKQK